jgi:hypothetical protein
MDGATTAQLGQGTIPLRKERIISIMGEYDNAGFPLTYCFLSTATAIDAGKRKKAIAAWSRYLRDKYSVNPVFIHSEKDIGAAQDVRQRLTFVGDISDAP